MARFFEETQSAHGRLDYAFNNAGIEGTPAPSADCTLENWNRTLAINLTGVWLCMREEIPRMLESGGGAIVNNASVAGLVGFAGIPSYPRRSTASSDSPKPPRWSTRPPVYTSTRSVPVSSTPT